MKILSIETSCDETAIAILDITGPLEKPDIKVLGNTLLSQVALHEQYGGVFPTLAKREHQKNLPILLEETLKQASLSLPRRGLGEVDIDFIAVTTGPGLEPALWTGITFAEDLGKKWSKPVVPVNHMEGHVFSVLYRTETEHKAQEPESKLEFPALALLVSGGHTELVHVKDFGNYEIIGRTLDDAAGEAFDKVARMLGLSYPGGPKISALAANSRFRIKDVGFKLPRPMINSGNLNFSFSGLKTAVLYKIKKDNREDREYKEDIAREFEEAVVEVLVEKTRQALETLDGIKTLIVAGGVAANKHLRERLEESIETRILFPSPLLTTDNAIMIGIAGYVRATLYPELLEKKSELIAEGNLSINSERSRTISSPR